MIGVRIFNKHAHGFWLTNLFLELLSRFERTFGIIDDGIPAGWVHAFRSHNQIWSSCYKPTHQMLNSLFNPPQPTAVVWVCDGKLYHVISIMTVFRYTVTQRTYSNLSWIAVRLLREKNYTSRRCLFLRRFFAQNRTHLNANRPNRCSWPQAVNQQFWSNEGHIQHGENIHWAQSILDHKVTSDRRTPRPFRRPCDAVNRTFWNTVENITLKLRNSEHGVSKQWLARLAPHSQS